jgi:hypothetical protein
VNSGAALRRKDLLISRAISPSKARRSKVGSYRWFALRGELVKPAARLVSKPPRGEKKWSLKQLSSSRCPRRQ